MGQAFLFVCGRLAVGQRCCYQRVMQLLKKTEGSPDRSIHHQEEYPSSSSSSSSSPRVSHESSSTVPYTRPHLALSHPPSHSPTEVPSSGAQASSLSVSACPLVGPLQAILPRIEIPISPNSLHSTPLHLSRLLRSSAHDQELIRNKAIGVFAFRIAWEAW